MKDILKLFLSLVGYWIGVPILLGFIFIIGYSLLSLIWLGITDFWRLMYKLEYIWEYSRW